MCERQNDTTEPGERDAPPAGERPPASYYYDDATNYEIYDPAEDAEDEVEEDVDEACGPDAAIETS